MKQWTKATDLRPGIRSHDPRRTRLLGRRGRKPTCPVNSSDLHAGKIGDSEPKAATSARICVLEKKFSRVSLSDMAALRLRMRRK